MELLVIEDDPVIGKSLRKGLIEAGHGCVWAKEGERGLELAAGQQFDAIILDMMLPGLPGIDLLQQLRAGGNRTPVIVLTALGSVEERVDGLNAGADDYMVKPFALVELMARVEAVCRRAVTRPAAVIQAGSLTLDLATRRVTRGTRNRADPDRIQSARALDALCRPGRHAADAVRTSMGDRLGGSNERDRSPHQPPPRQVGQGF